MTKSIHTLALALAFALPSSAVVLAQDKPAAPAAPKAPLVVTPLKLQVVISRYQGERKISSLPYALSVNSIGSENAGRANLRMGAKVPVTMMMAPVSAGGKPVTDLPTAGPIQYQDVGTNIDCFVWRLDEGRYRVEITVDDSSIYGDEKGASEAAKGTPTFRSFRANDSMILKDGGTAQFTTATDKVSGETVKVDVTLNVVK